MIYILFIFLFSFLYLHFISLCLTFNYINKYIYLFVALLQLLILFIILLLSVNEKKKKKYLELFYFIIACNIFTIFCFKPSFDFIMFQLDITYFVYYYILLGLAIYFIQRPTKTYLIRPMLSKCYNTGPLSSTFYERRC